MRSSDFWKMDQAIQRDPNGKLDVFTMVVLRRRVESIIRDMINTLFRSGRSGVLNTAMDFSCSVVDEHMRTISSANGLPVHIGAIDLIPKAVVRKFGNDIAPGDCFANNSAYHGNTHCADFTLCTPVFFEGQIVFYTIARAHFGDMGFPTPTTYAPKARDVYEEGLKLPCVRIQRGRTDVREVIDICKANIRAPEQFYGDYLATLAAVRTGEQHMQALCAEFGLETVRCFLSQFQTYAANMAAAAIRKLPKARVTVEGFYDSETPLYPNGIPVRVTLDVDPEAAQVTVDLRDNIDNLPLGINLSEATFTASCLTAVLTVLGSDVPRCTGAFSRITILSREGSAVGLPRYPAATCSATSNLNQLLCPLVRSAFAHIGEGLGSACGTVGMPGSCAVVSGVDPRHGGRTFVNQIIMGYWGGPGVGGHDGWFTHGGSGSSGCLWQSSVEVVEQQQPVLVECLEIAVDSAGAGEWNGAPGAYCVLRSRVDGIRYTANTAGRDFPPFGVAGSQPGGANTISSEYCDGTRTILPNSVDVLLNTGDKLVSRACGGGGYGDPLAREPAKVAYDVSEGWISEGRAYDVYGVALLANREPDVAKTEQLRRTLRASQTNAIGSVGRAAFDA